MEPSNLPQKRTQKIIQPTATDLEPTTVNTVKTTPSSIYPTAADDLPQPVTPTIDTSTSNPLQEKTAQTPVSGQTTVEKQQIYNQYLASRDKKPKHTERVLLLIALYLLITTGINFLLAVIETGTQLISGSYALLGHAVVNILFALIPFVFSLYFYKRNEFTRLIVRLFLFISFIGMSVYLVQIARAMASFDDASTAASFFVSSQNIGILLLFAAHLLIFYFLGRQDVRRLFN